MVTIEKILVASTGNISLETSKLLEQWQERCWEVNLNITDRNGGWLISGLVPSENIPDDLLGLVNEAKRLDCTFLLLDLDADPLPDFPTYEW